MSGEIWVVLQQRDGVLHRMSREVVTAGQRLAGLTGGKVKAVLLGSGVGELATELASSIDVASVHVADHEALAEYTPGAYAGALAPALGEAVYIVFPHTYQSLDYFPRVAGRLGAAVVSNVVAVDQGAEGIEFRRPVLGGKLEARCRVHGDGPVCISVQSGAFSADDLRPGTATVVPLPVGSITRDRELLGVEKAAEEEVDLSKAEIVVAAGRGVGGEDKLEPIEELAAALGAEIGASRPVIDSGWLPRDRQIGSSGQTVAPKLYVACGISGAIQHLVGMKGSGCVVAINKDASAPIFSVARYGIVGDLHEIVPEITKAVIEAKGG